MRTSTRCRSLELVARVRHDAIVAADLLPPAPRGRCRHCCPFTLAPKLLMTRPRVGRGTRPPLGTSGLLLRRRLDRDTTRAWQVGRRHFPALGGWRPLRFGGWRAGFRASPRDRGSAGLAGIGFGGACHDLTGTVSLLPILSGVFRRNPLDAARSLT